MPARQTLVQWKAGFWDAPRRGGSVSGSRCATAANGIKAPGAPHRRELTSDRWRTRYVSIATQSGILDSSVTARRQTPLPSVSFQSRMLRYALCLCFLALAWAQDCQVSNFQVVQNFDRNRVRRELMEFSLRSGGPRG